ncbi:MAG: DNA primase [Flavobacteriales bacterium]|nr:DNA primase [Flavobacteriales bacterium]
MKISQKTIDEIFNTVVIEDVIAEFVALKKTGANYKALSPFSDEKTPSFVVSPAKEIWKDFSSGKGGNVISFLMEHEQYSYPEALLFLAKKYSINVEYIEIDSRQQEKENERQAAIIVLNFTKDIFVKNLFSKEKRALNYLSARGFTNETLKLFEIGYCGKSDNQVAKELKKLGYNISYLQQSNVLNKNENIRFGGRIIFPIHSLNGDVLGFGARILDNKLKVAKYLNSDTSDLYQKSKILYGMHLAKKSIKKMDFCYIVEGYTDVMALFKFGIKNVVSSCGTALTKEQIRLIHRFTNNITILFDSYKAGISATLKAIDATVNEGMQPKILQLPPGEDPASFLIEGSQNDIDQYIQNHTMNFIDFKCQLSEHNDTETLINTTKSIIATISLMSDSISRSFHIKEASKKLDISENNLLAELDVQLKNHTNGLKYKKNKIEPSIVNDAKYDFEKLSKNYIEELQLIRLLIAYGFKHKVTINGRGFSIADFILSELAKDSKDINSTFSIPIFNQVLTIIKEKISVNQNFSKDYFLNHSNDELRSFTAYILTDRYLLGSWENKDIIVVQEEDILFKVTKEAILRFKLKRVQQILQEIMLELKESNATNPTLIKKFTQLSKVEKKIQQNLGRIF